MSSSSPSLYRRHRPRTFADVVGQEHVVRTLRNAVEKDSVHHAYLFVGSRGTGKTSMAKILAACLNCVDGPTITPCGGCDSCVSIASASSLDVIEMDAASNNSVDDIRDLRERVAYAPVSGRHKVYILDEAHMLSPQAWNAFLKTLEEPPPRTIFVLATTEAQKVLPTVVDRCHRFDFGRPSIQEVAMVLRRVAEVEQIEIDQSALALVARHATGSFRDALGTLEQLVTYAGGAAITPSDVLAVLGVADVEQLFEAVDAIVASDPAQALRAAAQLAASGRDAGQVLRDLEVHARELLAVQILGEVPAEISVTDERDRRLFEQARALAETDAIRLLDLLAAALEATANGAQARIQLELVLVKAAAPGMDPSVSALQSRVQRLEAALRGADAPPPAASAPRTTPASQAPTTPASQAPSGGASQAPSEGASQAPSEGASQAPIGGVSQAPSEGASQAPSSRSQEPPKAPSGSPRPESSAPPKPDPAASKAPSAPPPSAPPSSAPVDPSCLTLEAATSAWPAIVDLVRAENAMLAASLAAARPLAVTDRELALAFPTGAAFLKRKAEQDDHRRVAAAALQAITGQRLALRYELLDEEVAQSTDSDSVLSGEELVRRFMEEFDAEEIEHEPSDEGALR